MTDTFESEALLESKLAEIMVRRTPDPQFVDSLKRNLIEKEKTIVQTRPNGLAYLIGGLSALLAGILFWWVRDYLRKKARFNSNPA